MKDYCELEQEEYKQMLQWLQANPFKAYNEKVATACLHANVLEWRMGSREFFIWTGLIAAWITKYRHCVICDITHMKTT